MMGAGLYDILATFGLAEAIAAAGQIGDTLDLSQVTPKLGASPHAPWLVITTNTAPTDAADTLSIELQQCDDDGAGSPDGAWETVAMVLCGAAGAEVVATDARLATAGAAIWQGPLPLQVNKQHIRLYANNTTSNGQFKVDAILAPAVATKFRQSQVIKSPVGNP